jgi:hypothetical protein
MRDKPASSDESSGPQNGGPVQSRQGLELILDFFKTVPGLITAIAALIGALSAAGFFLARPDHKAPNSAQTTVQANQGGTSSTQGAPLSPGEGKLAGQVAQIVVQRGWYINLETVPQLKAAPNSDGGPAIWSVSAGLPSLVAWGNGGIGWSDNANPDYPTCRDKVHLGAGLFNIPDDSVGSSFCAKWGRYVVSGRLLAIGMDGGSETLALTIWQR